MLIHDVFHNDDGRLGRLCLIHGGRRITYQKFAGQVHELACRLATRMKQHDRVLVKMSDPLTQLVYFFSILKAGGACAFIDPAASAEMCAGLLARHHFALYIDETFVPPAAKAGTLPSVQPDDVFFGAFSSGSTGSPKLIWRDHRSWSSGFAAQSEVFHIAAGDVAYLAGSLVYTANLNLCVHMLAEGGTVVFAGSGMPRTWRQEIAACQANILFMVPVNYRLLLTGMAEPLAGVKSVISAGAKLDSAAVRRLTQFFPGAQVYEYYGASELGHVSYAMAADLLQYPDSVGRAFPGVTISIEDGLIWVSGPCLAPGYRPKASVGDLGRLDADGRLYVLGRQRGLINTGGVKVIPEQVEAVLRQCPGIAEAAVCGIDDALRGQKVCAWLVRDDAALTNTAVLAFCRRRLLPHYCPQQMTFVEALPINANGKIDRTRLLSSQSSV